MRSPILLALVLCLLLAGCAAPEVPATEAPVTETPVTEPPTEAETAPPETSPPPTVVESLMAEMTLEEKVGQLFIVRPEALDATGTTGMTDGLAAALETYPVCGFIFFGSNITDPQQITGFTQALQEASHIPLFLSVDEEGGTVARLANHKAFDLPRYKNAASIQDEAAALDMGSTIGAYLREYGFNLDFAPVADVNTNPKNPVIGKRAFSTEPETAAALAAAMAKGLTKQGIIPTYKHFPGHGDTAQDSHTNLAVSHKTYEELMACEWIPFTEATPMDFVMVGHIALPEITGTITPATLSREIVTGILKEQLGFEGLVITDALEMGAITAQYSSGEAAVAALQAGCHILLIPENFHEAFQAVVDAVRAGPLTESWLDETVEQILLFKQGWNLLPQD